MSLLIFQRVITTMIWAFNAMLELLPPLGGICLQGEDEIASIGYCLGASMAGLKVMTATSGPGISLYSEHISFAIGSEIPIVIVDVQRPGRSGLPLNSKSKTVCRTREPLNLECL